MDVVDLDPFDSMDRPTLVERFITADAVLNALPEDIRRTQVRRIIEDTDGYPDVVLRSFLRVATLEPELYEDACKNRTARRVRERRPWWRFW